VKTRSVPLQSDTIVKRLHKLHPKTIDLSLNRIKALLNRLGSPEQSLKSVIHVAGTNGKGSTIAFLKAILESAGLIVNCYTSPHLVKFTERILVEGKQLEEDILINLLRECETTNAKNPITFFEITTAAALLVFSRSNADVNLIETGLGGRFDATNVFEKPALSIITPISMDHMKWLGNTLPAIAYEKAGILKPATTTIVAPQKSEVKEVIKNRGDNVGARLLFYNTHWTFDIQSDGFSLIDNNTNIKLPNPSLIGIHQIMNAAAAAISARHIPNLAITDLAIEKGLQNTKWPGRLERLVSGPLVSLLPKGWALWLDGGHNVAAAEALTEVVKQWTDQKLYAIFGCLNTRDPYDFLSPLAQHIDQLFAVTIPGEKNSLPGTAVARAAKRVGISSFVAESVKDAITVISNGKMGQGRVLICGSLYLVGTVLSEQQNNFPD